MTKKTTVRAMRDSGLFHFLGRREMECRGKDFTTCCEWLERHFGEKNVYPRYSPNDWHIYIEIEGGVAIWCHD